MLANAAGARRRVEQIPLTVAGVGASGISNVAVAANAAAPLGKVRGLCRLLLPPGYFTIFKAEMLSLQQDDLTPCPTTLLSQKILFER